MTFRQQGKSEALAGLEQRKRDIDSAIGGAAAGGVAIEAEHRLVRHLPAQHDLVVGQRRAERRYGGVVARRHHRNDVDITLDRNERGALVCGSTGGRDVVERRAFVEECRLRRIEILRLRVLLQRTAAEGDHATAQVGDRKDHPITKAVVGHRDVVTGHQQARRNHVLDRNALLAEVLLERKALVRCVADAKLELRCRIEAAVGEITARPGAEAPGECRLKELCREFHHIVQGAAALFARFVLARHFRQFHAGLRGEPFDRFRK